MLFESIIFNLLPIIVGILVVAMVFESCWRKCPPDKLMIVSGFGQMRSVSGKGTFVIPLLQRVDTLSLGAVQVQLTTENDIPTQDAILIHACAVANFQIGQTPELIETASKNYLNMDKEEMTRQVTEVMLGKMREVIGQMDLKELMRDRESFNAKVFDGSKDDLANLGLELRTFNVQDFSDSQGIIRSMGADQAAEIKKEAELAQIKAAEEVGLQAASEVFADRAYNDDGTLVSRKLPGAVIKDKDLAIKRVVRMVKEGKVESINGNDISIKADSICVHGDNPKALEFVKNIRETLVAEGVEIKNLFR